MQHKVTKSHQRNGTNSGERSRTFNFLEQLVRALKLINIELVSIENNFNKDKVAVFNFNDITISFEIREKLKRV